MQNNTNNPLTEVSAIVLAALLIIAGGLLLYVGKVDFTQATLIFGLAVTIYGGNLALKAPSPTQQSQIAAIASQQSNVISQMVGQQVQAPQQEQASAAPKFTTMVPQPPVPQFVQPAPQPQFQYAPTGTYPMPAVQQPPAQ